jgi:multimeric flavodoxin WrbA
MHIVVLACSPNKDGLTAALSQAAWEGVREGGAEGEALCLNHLKVGACQACDNGWGTCNKSHECQVLDGYQDLHARVRAADGLVIVTPVYWGEPSEPAKAFLDRLRRCEASLGSESRLAGKPVIAVAAAGGSGNGTVTCLLSLERWTQHVRARVFDLIAVNRWTRAYKLDTVRAAAYALVREAKG